MMKVELRLSNDGSSTLYNVDLDETYHSVHGAIQEAKHVFIEKGLRFKMAEQSNLSILEIGFGTGLNALLTINEVLNKEGVQINYVGIEKFPVDIELLESVNYCNILGGKTHFDRMHQANWNSKEEITPTFSLNKLTEDIRQVRNISEFDIIYFDAFSPTSQPELWSVDVFQNMFNSLKENGILVTYCAKGQVRRDLQSVGFKMERLLGPPGKREMLRGTK